LRALLYEGGRVNLRALAAERSNHNSTPEGADGEARVFPPKAKTVARAASTGQESRRPTLGPPRGMRPRRSRRTTRARPAAGVLQSPAPTRRPEGDRESRADEHPAPVLPADPALARRREDGQEVEAHVLRVRRVARARLRRRLSLRRLPDSLAHLNFPQARRASDSDGTRDAPPTTHEEAQH